MFNLQNKIHFMFIFVFLIFSTQVFATGLKKVLILDFINIEKDENFQYLERSITNAVKTSLKDKFAYKTTPEKKWKKISETNFIFRKDYYTQTAAMNLGLLAKQDIVISGGFKIKNIRKRRKVISIIEINASIHDIAKRKTIANITMKAKADSSIFTTIDNIVKKIVQEAASVLPNKDEWAKKGIIEEKPSEPFFIDPIVSIKAGGAMYTLGYADRITTDLPSLELGFHGNLPFLWKPLSVEFNFQYIKHTWNKDYNEITETMTIETSNYITGMFLGIDISLFSKINLRPFLGGGYVFQNTTIISESLITGNNGFPFAGSGIDLSYQINRFIDAVLTIKSIAEFESNTITFLNSTQLGVNMRL